MCVREQVRAEGAGWPVVQKILQILDEAFGARDVLPNLVEFVEFVLEDAIELVVVVEHERVLAIGCNALNVRILI